MRNDFCALILTHGRPDNVLTLETLRRHGYTGPAFIVIDDEDKSAPAYRARYGNKVVTFSKAEIAKQFDEADNFNDRRAIFYARNASFDIARGLGYRYFVQLDDDYYVFVYRRADKAWKINGLNNVFGMLVDFLSDSGALTVALSQGGDHIGGFQGERGHRLKRKAMNSFICDVEKPFPFLGRVNEDVNTYVTTGNRGGLFFTAMSLQLDQNSTQANGGGMSDLYLDAGTYVKSFYSVMHAPSCVKIGSMGRFARRLHHHVEWGKAVPCIISEEYKKPTRAAH
jgi:hypothetical protein